jgi:heme iron utilization protein
MGTDEQALATLKTLLTSQRLAVLATHSDGQPHASLVGFAVTDDLKHVVFATPRATRKFANLQADARVAMLVDSRSHQASDFEQAGAVTVVGRARQVRRKKGSRFTRLFLEKHASLEAFVMSPTCALMVVDVERYSLVTRFQDVVEFPMPDKTAGSEPSRQR